VSGCVLVFRDVTESRRTARALAQGGPARLAPLPPACLRIAGADLPLAYRPLPGRETVLDKIRVLERMAGGDIDSPEVQSALILLADLMNIRPGERPDVARVRYAVPAELSSGSDRMWEAEFETLTEPEALREDAMLGMRLAEGISDELASEADVIGPLEGLVRDGLVEHRDGRWRPTERGWLLGNQVFSRIWLV
jgi:hypothetical protein